MTGITHRIEHMFKEIKNHSNPGHQIRRLCEVIQKPLQRQEVRVRAYDEVVRVLNGVDGPAKDALISMLIDALREVAWFQEALNHAANIQDPGNRVLHYRDIKNSARRHDMQGNRHVIDKAKEGIRLARMQMTPDQKEELDAAEDLMNSDI